LKLNMRLATHYDRSILKALVTNNMLKLTAHDL
jgi:hypothetical protein